MDPRNDNIISRWGAALRRGQAQKRTGASRKIHKRLENQSDNSPALNYWDTHTRNLERIWRSREADQRALLWSRKTGFHRSLGCWGLLQARRIFRKRSTIGARGQSDRSDPTITSILATPTARLGTEREALRQYHDALKKAEDADSIPRSEANIAAPIANEQHAPTLIYRLRKSQARLWHRHYRICVWREWMRDSESGPASHPSPLASSRSDGALGHARTRCSRMQSAAVME